MEMELQGRRKRDRPKRIWLDTVSDDIKENGMSGEQGYGQAVWKCISSHIHPIYK